MLKLGLLALLFSNSPVFCMVNLTVNSLKMCPEATLTCSAKDLPSTTLRWFFDDNEFARYTITISDLYPIRLEPANATYDALLGGLSILVLEASLNENNQDRANFLSSMSCNVSSLLRAGISAIGCGSFSEMATRPILQDENFTFPALVGVSVQPDDSLQSQITAIHVQWNKVIVRKEYCHYTVNYTIYLNKSKEETIERVEVGAESCVDNICSTSLFPSRSEQMYIVEIVATSTIGSSSTVVNTSLAGLVHYFNFYFIPTNSSCLVLGLCSSQLELSECLLQYGTESISSNLSSPIHGSINYPFSLPLLKEFTTYYYTVSLFVESSLRITTHGMYMTRNCDSISSKQEGNKSYWYQHVAFFVLTCVLMFTLCMIILATLITFIKKIMRSRWNAATDNKAKKEGALQDETKISYDVVQLASTSDTISSSQNYAYNAFISKNKI